MLTTEPASSMVWLIVVLAEHVIVASGARLAVGGQATVTLLSVTPNGANRVTLPVFFNT